MLLLALFILQNIYLFFILINSNYFMYFYLPCSHSLHSLHDTSRLWYTCWLEVVLLVLLLYVWFEVRGFLVLVVSLASMLDLCFVVDLQHVEYQFVGFTAQSWVVAIGVFGFGVVEIGVQIGWGPGSVEPALALAERWHHFVLAEAWSITVL